MSAPAADLGRPALAGPLGTPRGVRTAPGVGSSAYPVAMAAGEADGAVGVDRVRLEALRYAVNDEAAQYIAVMRLFTSGLTGLLSDQSAAEVRARLAEVGIDLDEDTVEARLSYLVEHGNLARSPRETEARSLADYLRNRARYQLSPRGELVHRQVEELLGHSDAAREVSTEMLGDWHGMTRRVSPTQTPTTSPARSAPCSPSSTDSSTAPGSSTPT